jgi:large subunit ribosomal protein L3
MITTILGKKLNMSQTFIEGRRVPVTKVVAGPCVVTQVKTMESDGYNAVQLGFGERRIKTISKPEQGHLKGAIKDNKAPRFLVEVRLTKEPTLKLGDTVKLSDIFRKGDVIQVMGISKGKGFAGVVKKWGFAGGPRTHGQSDRERAPGSIGQTTTPGRVYRGKKMAGRMGSDRKTIKNLQIISVNAETNEIEILGPIPGVKGGLIEITRLSEGKLEGIQEVQAQVVEGEPEAPVEGEAAKLEEVKEEVKEEKTNE